VKQEKLATAGVAFLRTRVGNRNHGYNRLNASLQGHGGYIIIIIVSKSLQKYL
jgi:hypothetical protein